MGAMALTHLIDAQAPASHGDQRVIIDKVTFDNNYVTGGYAVTPGVFGGLVYLQGIIVSDVGGANYCEYDSVAKKLKLFVRATGAEVGNGVDASATVTNLLVIGK